MFSNARQYIHDSDPFVKEGKTIVNLGSSKSCSNTYKDINIHEPFISGLIEEILKK